MRIHTLLPAVLTYTAAVIHACGPPTVNSSQITLHDDCPADAATLGFTINHFCLISKNLTTTEQFYGTVLGMRRLFTYHASDKYDVLYMGNSHGGKNGTGYQSGAELNNQKNNIEGLIEFFYIHDGDANLTASAVVPNTFSHIGLVVPDIVAAQERFETYGVKILKRFGDLPQNEPGPLANAYGLSVLTAIEREQAIQGIAGFGFGNFVIIEDPDGNVLEVQQQF